MESKASLLSILLWLTGMPLLSKFGQPIKLLGRLHKLSGFIFAYYPMVRGLNPKLTIYNFVVKFSTIFVIVLRKGRK